PDRLTATVRAGASAPPHALPPIADPATGVAIASLEVARDNLLLFELAGDGPIAGARLAIRPSGTEPKCKFYTSVWTAPGTDLSAITEAVNTRTASIQDEFIACARRFV
ncbi:MAG: hypothetical protein FJX72_17375, partial [Armatimonadetes bacterium]|nr:hypothetical protein [Armatimonadota bacterium]